MRKNFLIAMLLCLKSIAIFSEDVDLEYMLEQNLISREDYEILKSEYSGPEKKLYALMVNGALKDYMFSVYYDNNVNYIPLKAFLKSINFTNYKWEDKKIILKLGNNLEEVTIDLKKIAGKYMEKDGDIYLNEGIFKDIFASNLYFNKTAQELSINLSFLEPNEIKTMLNITENKLKQKSSKLVFQNKPQLFELGYLRVAAHQNFTKPKGEREYKKDWSGELEYQGPLLYGDFLVDYDFKNKELGHMELKYPEIIKRHTLEIDNDRYDEHKRVSSLKFAKTKNYYQSGKSFIITQDVPIESRVELLYMGIPIQIKSENKGKVVFDSPEIKGDSTYILRVYERDGKIYEKEVTTTDDYNLQNKGELEYDLNIKQNIEADSFDTKINTFYGVTNNLTLGGGYSRNNEMVNGKYHTIDGGNLQTSYTNMIGPASYTVSLGGEQTFSKLKDREKDYSKRYKYNLTNQLNVSKFKFVTNYTTFGSYYDEKYKFSENITYNVFSNLTLDYGYERVAKRDNLIESKRNGSIRYTNSFYSLMNTFEINKKFDSRLEDEYAIRTFYSGFKGFTASLDNTWRASGQDYELGMSIYSNGNNWLNYSVSLSYSEKYKEKIALNFNLIYDNWFEFGGKLDAEGAEEYNVGVNKVIDLKHPTSNIDSVNVSRVRVTAFVDSNGNNSYDKGEKLIDNAVVTIGSDEAVTNQNGVAMFYGLANGIENKLEIKLRKPSYTMGDRVIIIRGMSASTIDAYIPVQEMTNLSGLVYIDELLNLTEAQKQDVYENTLIYVKDLDGNVLEITTPDENGEFDVSGLFQDEYIVELEYYGSQVPVSSFKQRIQVGTYEDSKKNKWVFRFGEDCIALAKEDVFALNMKKREFEE